MDLLSKVNPKKRGKEKLDAPSASLSSSSPSSWMRDGSAASRWSKEVMWAIEAHLALLHQHYSQDQHQRGSTMSYQSVCVKDLEDDDCVSELLHGHNDDDADEDGDGDDVEQSGIGTMQLADHISCQGDPLPEGWEQHLDLRTGQVFYIHWKSCKKSKMDPRKMVYIANERIQELMHQTRKEPPYCDRLLSSMHEEETAKTSPSECVTSQSASINSCNGEEDGEVQSKNTSCCINSKN